MLPAYGTRNHCSAFRSARVEQRGDRSVETECVSSEDEYDGERCEGEGWPVSQSMSEGAELGGRTMGSDAMSDLLVKVRTT